MNYIKLYWDEIQSGKIIVGEDVRLQIEILIDDLDNPKEDNYWNEIQGVEVKRRYVFNEELGEYVIDFIEENCKHSKAPWTGKPVILELWQKARFQAAYGFIDEYTGLRQYREVQTWVGRKNGKTTEGAADGLYHEVGDDEGGAEIYSVATKKDIARKSWGEAANMVTQSEDLAEIITKRKSDLYHEDSMSEFKPLASDANSLDGLNSSCVLMDEVHAWKDRNLYDVMKQSTGARLQPMMWIMSTMGTLREGIADTLLDNARNELRGNYPRDFTKLYFIYCLDKRDEWLDPKMWQKANPGLGTIKRYDYLHAMVKAAKNDPMFLPTVLTKDFNVIEGVAGTWLNFETIVNTEKFDMDFIKGSYGLSGTDMSSTLDLTCATLLFIKADKYKLFPKRDEFNNIIEGEFEKGYYKYLHQMYFIPEDIVEEKVKVDGVPYDKWAEMGWVKLTPGATVDKKHVTNWFVDMHEKYEIIPLWNGFDPWGTDSWVPQMKEYGFNMEDRIPQGARTMSGPAKRMAGDLKDDLLIYNDNPIFKWCLSNTSMKTDENDNIRPIKGKGQKLRIDGTVSAINAYVTLERHEDDYMNMI